MPEDRPTSRERHQVDEVPPAGRTFVYGMQHVLSMYAGIIAVPLILASAIGLPQNQLIYAINASFFRFTGIMSRFVVAAAGGILVFLRLLPKLGAVVSSIPLPVLGGAGLVLFGTVAAAGIQTLSTVDLADNRNLIIVAVSVALGIIPAAVPDFYEQFPQAVRIIFESGITAAAVAAILLNVVFNILGARYETPTLAGETTSRVPAAEREEV